MQFCQQTIQAMAKDEYFGPGNAQLPKGQMLMIDEISHISRSGGRYQQGQVIAQFKIRPDFWFFDCHFQNDPVMPGCLGLDAMWQLLGVFLGFCGLPGRGRAIGVGNVRFSGQIYPRHEVIEYRLDIKRVFQKPLALALADGAVYQQGKAIYQAQDLKVGLVPA
ncbi:bifunctional 3-hydroxydecanoyl-ACP dehydratase/trans-2-decenoyl-ACP isomerase [Motilimonas pumila]|uniref:Bifunctional 3-hydroxydecanoyl-ACP dehydratase/trans-2-decenoyl-ACP isomerase n=1 Tax=Motilimonas pumila TaxID=2303987 RepID=A0A418YAL2_9GAMM|nr:bifunctional 3-hydroxydecanoyl-ACP dehydratase/trans-2-decenoyl-ACP isomerase [Motilimonas pumila]RJG39999.1 bifunctional 3-hydroxydecanoyl-ACP dehydratase/trans-2-decenoyl-ACP isomerase [Motilimonas pumila]